MCRYKHPLSLAVSSEYRRVTDRRADRRTRTSCDSRVRAMRGIARQNHRSLILICITSSLESTSRYILSASPVLSRFASSFTCQLISVINHHSASITSQSTKFAERAFSFSGPAEWNCLPSDLRMITDTTFLKKKLKAYFYKQAFFVL